MLEIIDIGIENAVAFRWGGKITEAEMKSVFSALKEKIKNYGKISVYQEIESIGGVEFEGIVEELRFLKEFGLSNFSKITIVTDKKWLKRIVEIEDKIFKKIDIKCFSTDEKNEAIEFLKND
jgi:hypothetical protein